MSDYSSTTLAGLCLKLRGCILVVFACVVVVVIFAFVVFVVVGGCCCIVLFLFFHILSLMLLYSCGFCVTSQIYFVSPCLPILSTFSESDCYSHCGCLGLLSNLVQCIFLNM